MMTDVLISSYFEASIRMWFLLLDGYDSKISNILNIILYSGASMTVALSEVCGSAVRALGVTDQKI